MSRTLTLVYDDQTSITLARPSIADGRIRRQIFAALTALKADAYVDLFAYFVTQLDTPVLGFERIKVYPGDDAIMALYTRWCETIDEPYCTTLTAAIRQLNDLDVPDSAKKKLEQSLGNTSDTVTTPSQSVPMPN
jgi:hypothetical protein